MYGAAILKLQAYIDEYLFDPPKRWPPYYVDERRYARWAAEEILAKLMQKEEVFSCTVTPLEIIVDFEQKLDLLSEIPKDPNHEAIFVMARDSVKELRYLFEQESV